MKKAYLIRMSEDGNFRTIYTNVNALYTSISQRGLYGVKFIEKWDCTTKNATYIKLTYPNLVKALKESKNDLNLYKDSNGEEYGTLTIEQVIISSK